MKLYQSSVFWKCRARARNQHVNHQHTYEQRRLPEHCAQPDVPQAGRWEWSLFQAGHRESGEEAEREKRRARLPHYRHYHQWSPSQQVCYHSEDTWRASAGRVMPYLACFFVTLRKNLEQLSNCERLFLKSNDHLLSSKMLYCSWAYYCYVPASTC